MDISERQGYSVNEKRPVRRLQQLSIPEEHVLHGIYPEQSHPQKPSGFYSRVPLSVTRFIIPQHPSTAFQLINIPATKRIPSPSASRPSQRRVSSCASESVTNRNVKNRAR